MKAGHSERDVDRAPLSRGGQYSLRNRGTARLFAWMTQIP